MALDMGADDSHIVEPQTVLKRRGAWTTLDVGSGGWLPPEPFSPSESSSVPYRIDVLHPPADALDRLVALDALDVEAADGAVAAILPDSSHAQAVADALTPGIVSVSAAIGRDDGSVWILNPRPTQVGSLLLVPAHLPATPGALRLGDGPAFGTGLHVTTALCLEALDDLLETTQPARMLDVGVGSGVLALAALLHGVPSAVGVDIDPKALAVAADNARLNGLEGRLQLLRGGPDAVDDRFPLVLANVLAAPLMDMAATLVQRVGHGGELVLSGVHSAVASDVERTYRRLGMRHVRTETRGGWSMLLLRPSW